MFTNCKWKFSPSAPPQTHTHMLRQFCHIPSKCIDKGFLCRPAATRTAAARVWPTHHAEEMQIYCSKP